jgi:hypothetical protein
MLRAGSWSRAALAVLLAAAAAVLGACGDDGDQGRPLSAARASELRSTLSQIEQSVAGGDCNSAATQAQTLEQEASDLPRGIDSHLRRALRSSSQRLSTLVERECGATGSTGPTGPTEPSGPTGTTGEQGDEGDQGENGKQKEKKPKKDNGKRKGQQHEPPADETTPPDTGGAGGGGDSGGDSGADGGGFVP